MKTTVVSALELSIAEYENLEELWKVYSQGMKDEEDLLQLPLRKINPSNYSRGYEQNRKKIERHLKDPDLGELSKKVADSLENFLSNLDVVTQINTEHLRQQDLSEINLMI